MRGVLPGVRGRVRKLDTRSVAGAGTIATPAPCTLCTRERKSPSTEERPDMALGAGTTRAGRQGQKGLRG